MTDQRHVELVGDALRRIATQLQPWIETTLGEWPPDRYGRVTPSDPSYLIGVLIGHWRNSFATELGPEGLTLVQDLRHTRNRWAHHVPFDRLDVVRALDTCRRLSALIGADPTWFTDQIAALLDTPASTPTPTPRPARRPSSGRTHTHRRMTDPAFREQQWADRFAPHVQPVNTLVDELIEQHPGSWMPYVAPHHGGINAEILMLFQDPGPMTVTDQGGSGFLSCENDDPSANLLADCLDAAGVGHQQIIPWNAYPWNLGNGKPPTARQIQQGLEPLRELLELLPNLHTVIACGRVAQESWRRFADAHPARARLYRRLDTFHTSGRGITNGGQQTRQDGIDHVTHTLRQAATT